VLRSGERTLFGQVGMGSTSSTSLRNLRSSQLILVTGAVDLYRNWNWQYKKWNPTDDCPSNLGKKPTRFLNFFFLVKKSPTWLTQNFHENALFVQKWSPNFTHLKFFGDRVTTGACTGCTLNGPVQNCRHLSRDLSEDVCHYCYCTKLEKKKTLNKTAKPPSDNLCHRQWAQFTV
jgi:hypothetical protein